MDAGSCIVQSHWQVLVNCSIFLTWLRPKQSPLLPMAVPWKVCGTGLRDRKLCGGQCGGTYESVLLLWSGRCGDFCNESLRRRQLLNARTSPFGRALTQYQCIQYALDKPGVLTVLPGIRDNADLNRILGFCAADLEARDYSVIGSFAPQDAAGNCVYCNHCQPCPAGLDVGLINKYYDLAKAGDQLAKNHYENLTVKADACIGCSHCNSRCPFHVDQVARMQEILAYFEKWRGGWNRRKAICRRGVRENKKYALGE